MQAKGRLDVRKEFKLTSIGSRLLATFPEGESEGRDWN